jgi:hypothetical protein
MRPADGLAQLVVLGAADLHPPFGQAPCVAKLSAHRTDSPARIIEGRLNPDDGVASFDGLSARRADQLPGGQDRTSPSRISISTPGHDKTSARNAEVKPQIVDATPVGERNTTKIPGFTGPIHWRRQAQRLSAST